MSTFTLSVESTVEVEESAYDDTFAGAAWGDLQWTYNGEPVHSQKVKLLDLAEALGASLRACLFNTEIHSEWLWETGRSMTMRRTSVATVALAFPTGTSEMLLKIEEIEALILELYQRGFSALIAHAAGTSR